MPPNLSDSDNLSNVSDNTEADAVTESNEANSNSDTSSQHVNSEEAEGDGNGEEEEEEDNLNVSVPDWVNRLKDYFEFINQRTYKENITKRVRKVFTLQCLICKKAKVDNRTRAVLQTKKRGSKSCKQVPTGVISGKSSNSFKRHLELVHPDEHDPKVYFRHPKAIPHGCGARVQETIATSVVGIANSNKTSHLKPYDINSAKMKEFQIGVLNMITMESLPLSFTEAKGFRMLISLIDSRLTVPSRRTIGRLLDQKFIMVSDHIRECVQDAKAGSAHLLLDMWTSRQNTSVIGIQVRFIKNWEIKQVLLGFRHFHGPHNAKSIRKKLDDLLVKEYQLPLHHFSTVTADNASAILNAFKLQYDDDDKPSQSTLPISIASQPEKSPDDDEEDLWEDLAEKELNFEHDLLLDMEMEHNLIEAIAIMPESHSATQNITRNSCLAHLLQLAIRDALKEVFVCVIARKLNAIVSWFHKSQKFNDVFQDLSGLTLVKPVDTRWNSLYYCMKRFCRVGKGKSKKKLVVICNEVLKDAKKQSTANKKIPATITDDEMAAIEVIVELLEPLAHLTDEWQSDGVTSSLVIMSFLNALQVLEEIEISNMLENIAELSSFKSELKKCLVERFSYDKSRGQKVYNKDGKERRIVTVDIFHDPFYVLATLLDPRIKTVPFEAQTKDHGARNGLFTKEEVIAILKQQVENERHLYPDIVDVTPEEISSANQNGQPLRSPASSQPLAKKRRTMWQVIDEKLEQTKHAKAEVDEVELYLNALQPLLPTENPLTFWKKNEDRLPTLSSLAKKYLAMPATSASVERLFSMAGSVIRCRRARLKIETAEKLLFYQDYLKNGL